MWPTAYTILGTCVWSNLYLRKFNFLECLNIFGLSQKFGALNICTNCTYLLEFLKVLAFLIRMKLARASSLTPVVGHTGEFSNNSLTRRTLTERPAVVVVGRSAGWTHRNVVVYGPIHLRSSWRHRHRLLTDGELNRFLLINYKFAFCSQCFLLLYLQVDVLCCGQI